MANDIKKKQVSVLLSVVGGKTYTLLRDLQSPEKPADKPFCELQKVLLMHFKQIPACNHTKVSFPVTQSGAKREYHRLHSGAPSSHHTLQIWSLTGRSPT